MLTAKGADTLTAIHRAVIEHRAKTYPRRPLIVPRADGTPGAVSGDGFGVCRPGDPDYDSSYLILTGLAEEQGIPVPYAPEP